MAAETTGSTKKKDDKDLTDKLTDAAEETNNVSLAATMAGVESIAASADVARKYVDKVYDLNQEHGDKGKSGAITRLFYLPLDLAEAGATAFEEMARIPKRAVDKFNDVYED